MRRGCNTEVRIPRHKDTGMSPETLKHIQNVSPYPSPSKTYKEQELVSIDASGIKVLIKLPRQERQSSR
jgi:hypothetical protein